MQNFEIQNVMVLGWGFGQVELLIMAGVILVLFGGAKLPALMRNLGRSVNEFKAGIKEKPQEVPRMEENPADEAAVKN